MNASSLREERREKKKRTWKRRRVRCGTHTNDRGRTKRAEEESREFRRAHTPTYVHTHTNTRRMQKNAYEYARPQTSVRDVKREKRVRSSAATFANVKFFAAFSASSLARHHNISAFFRTRSRRRRVKGKCKNSVRDFDRSQNDRS